MWHIDTWQVVMPHQEGAKAPLPSAGCRKATLTGLADVQGLYQSDANTALIV